MRKEDFAETVLSLVAEPDRAASMAGDLSEEFEARPMRFWLAVAQTATAQLWRQLAAEPGVAGRAAVRSLFTELGYRALACLVWAMVVLVAISLAKVNFHAELPDLPLSTAATLAMQLVAVFFVGRKMVERYPGRAASAGLTLGILHVGINLTAAFLAWLVGLSGNTTFHADITVKPMYLIHWDGNVAATLWAAVFYLLAFPPVSWAGAFVGARSAPYRNVR
jgi:hypothetical protein